MEDTMEKTCGWGGDDNAPIPNDDKDWPLANVVDSEYAKGNYNNKYARGKYDNKYARGNNDHEYADGNNNQEYARDNDHRGEGMLKLAGFAEGRELSKWRLYFTTASDLAAGCCFDLSLLR